MIKQCKNCTHAKLCKFMDMTDQVKQEYPFIEDITCGYYEKEQKTAALKANSEPKTSSEASPVTVTSNGTEASENTEGASQKTRTRRKNPEALTEPPSDTIPAPIAEQKVEPKTETKEKDTLEFNDIELSLFNISERSVKALNNAGIRIIGDVYDFNESKKKWVSIKGFTKEHYEELSNKLIALNRPRLKPYSA